VRHEKLFVADGQRLLTGGSNVGDYYHTSSPWSAIWYDLDVLIYGPIACWYHNQLQDSWRIGVGEDLGLDLGSQAQAREISAAEQKRVERSYGNHRMERCHVPTAKRFGNSRVYAAYGRPASTKARPLMDTYLQAIDSAKHTIRLYAPYFVPEARFADALIRAAKRGVKVSVMTNSVASNDETTAIFSAMLLSVVHPLRKDLPALVRAGVKIELWPGKATLHRKGGVFDAGRPTQLAYLGSDNLDVRGQNMSSESIAWTDDPIVIAQLAADFRRDTKISQRLTRRLSDDWLAAERATVAGRFRLMVARRLRNLF